MAKSLIGPEKFTDEELKDITRVERQLMEMNPVSLRALIRQSSHRIDNGTQRYIFAPDETRPRLVNATSVLRLTLKEWSRRGYGIDKRDIRYAYDALNRGDEFNKTLKYKSSPPHEPYAESDLKVVERLIHERRSIRRFRNVDVPDELINKVIEAGTWAPCACCLQGSRFIVVKEASVRKMIVLPWAAPVIIIAGFDERPYEYLKNAEVPVHSYLDLGAAIQTMLLMAYALGLGAGWASFASELKQIRQALEVPDHIRLITYIGLGWPDDEPTTVPRMELEEYVSRERWSVRT